MNVKNVIPVALFAYARPDHLVRTLKGLRINSVPLIYAFCDGAKDDSKLEQTNKVREILHDIDWTEILIVERETNLGLGTSIKEGISKVLEKHDKVIVIEDDIVMRPGAYNYTCSALNYYEKDYRIMTVSLWNHPVMVPKECIHGFFSERFVCSGWGTYKKYWQLYSESIQEIYNSLDVNIKKQLNKYGKDLSQQVEYANRANIWYAGYALLHFKLGKMSFFPYETLVINIGTDDTAENDGPGHRSFIENEDLINIPVLIRTLNYFPEPVLLKKTKKLFFKYFYLKHPLGKRLWLLFKKQMYFFYKPIKKYVD